MNRRMAGSDASLNAPIRAPTASREWQDWLADDEPGQAEEFADQQEFDARDAKLLIRGHGDLNERERHILTERRLTDDPKTLEELSEEYNASAASASARSRSAPSRSCKRP
jgi:RNA polymerase sigma-32 factor